MGDTEERDKSQRTIKEESPLVHSQVIDLLVANVIPTTRYFESRFDFLQHQIDQIREGQKHLEDTMNRRFEQVDKRFEQAEANLLEFKGEVARRFEQVDKRFEQVDKRFEQVDKRFEQVEANLFEFKGEVTRRFGEVYTHLQDFKTAVDRRFEQVDKRLEQLVAAIERLTDRIEHRDEHQRNFTLRMFTISVTLSFLGVLGVLLKIFGII